MHVLPTALTLALMTLSIIILGIFWERIPGPIRIFLIRASIAMIVLDAIFAVTKWGTASDRLNVIIQWLGVAGYEILLVRFARLPPRWLTSLSAFVLVLPVFASSVLMPLTHFFDPSTFSLVNFDTDLAFQSNPWSTGEGPTALTGVELTVYYRPHFLPFLRQERQGVFFNDHQCDSAKAWISAGPHPKTIVAHCPHWPSQTPGGENWVYPLP